MASKEWSNKPLIQHDNPLANTLLQKLDYDQLTNCMRCGFCLPACPTFRETGVEAESPRGRIALMKAVADGIMQPDQAFREQMDHCLGCRACEPVCPADVKYGQLIEQARDAIEDHPRHSWIVTQLRNLFFHRIFPQQSRMKLLGRLLNIYQQWGLRKVIRGLGILKLFPKHMRDMERILPDASSTGVIEQLGTTIYPAKGPSLGRVGFFRGCLMDVLFTDTNVNTVKLLSEAGYEVFIPETQNCCGALHAHSGEMELARQLARKNIQAFKDLNVDYIISNAGGCGALLTEYDHLMNEDILYQADAAWFAERVMDINQFITVKGRPLTFVDGDHTVNAANAQFLRVTWQDSCHLRNVMKTGNAPRKLLQRVGGVTFVELKEADRCCGSAGIYNVTQPAMAGQILEHKMAHVHQTHSRYLLTGNPGCLLQMKLGIERHKPQEQMEAMHIVDFLYSRLSKS
jgi:glycolate oxidase iron-sulfur subunit